MLICLTSGVMWNGFKQHYGRDPVSLSPAGGGCQILILTQSAEKMFSSCCWVSILASCWSHLFLCVSGETGPLILLHTVGPEICQVLRAIPTSEQIHGLWEKERGEKGGGVVDRARLVEQFKPLVTLRENLFATRCFDDLPSKQCRFILICYERKHQTTDLLRYCGNIAVCYITNWLYNQRKHFYTKY